MGELKHALSLHYDIEGHTLLSDDQSFPYSDKEIELVCGSLVTVRKGTLQVIHLTVKEFLRATHGQGASVSSDLLVDPRQASLALTMVCLKCIEVSCTEPMVDLNTGIPRIDLLINPSNITMLRKEKPFVEYASFS